MTILTTLPIDASLKLRDQLGKARAGRIRYAQWGRYPKTPGSHGIHNPAHEAVQDIEIGRGHAVEAILYGFANSTDSNRPLAVTSLLTILQCVEIINSREISIMFAISPRQARKYFQVIKSALPFIVRATQEKSQSGDQDQSHAQ